MLLDNVKKIFIFVSIIICSGHLFGQSEKLLENIGEAIQFEFTDILSGQNINTAEMKDDIVVVHFWFKNCEPCQQNIPQIINLYNDYSSQNVSFIGVNIDSQLNDVIDFCKLNSITWPQLNDPMQDIINELNVSVIPAYFVIGKDGKIALATISSDLGPFLDQLLEQGGSL